MAEEDDIDLYDEDPYDEEVYLEDEDIADDEKEEDIADDEDEFFTEKDKFSASHCVVKVIPKSQRRTSDRMSLAEMVNIIGTRAQMMENGDEIYVSIGNTNTSMDLAKQELLGGRCPLKVERIIATHGNTIFVEHWSANELICTHLKDEILTLKNKG